MRSRTEISPGARAHHTRPLYRAHGPPIDPDTGELLGDRETVAGATGDLPEGTVLSSVSYTRSGVVGSVTALP